MQPTITQPEVSHKISHKRVKADLILLLAAIVWGSAFVPQRMIANELGVFIFNGLRFILGGLVLLPLVHFDIKIEKKHLPPVLLAGFLLFSGSALQQAGLRNTSAGNAGFITGLYVVIVPIFMSLFWKQKLYWTAWLAAFISVIGLFLLSVDHSLRVNPGDSFELVGAAFWALHIIIVGIMVKRIDALRFSILQFFTCGLLNLVAGMFFEFKTLQSLPSAAWAVLYTGIISVGAGYTLQALGQKNSPPADASIILSMEAVFAAFFGVLILQEEINLRKIIGCILIFLAIILSQLHDTQEPKQNNPS